MQNETTPKQNQSQARLINADCRDALKLLPDNSVDSIVTDPPAGIGFMGAEWDKDKGGRDSWISWMAEVAADCLRVIKPGGHAMVWALPRTSHWTATAWEDAGWEVRDRISHLFSSGFPKSLNLKGEFEGWGTALKPAMEDWWLLRKPLIGTVAANSQKHGTGALNINDCRVPIDIEADASQLRTMARGQRTQDTSGQVWGLSKGGGDVPQVVRPEGRWPANVVHSGLEEEWSRYFYCAKASKSDRNFGLAEGLSNTHVTVKPLQLMRYLCRLTTPPSGICLDPFLGSGSTGVAALLEGFRFIGIEREPEYFAIAQARIAAASPGVEVEAVQQVAALQPQPEELPLFSFTAA